MRPEEKMRPEIGGIYKRFDGKYFVVLEIAKTSDGSEFVIHRSLEDDISIDALAVPVDLWYHNISYNDVERPCFIRVFPEKEFAY